ncbi:hypothetical protein, partial [Sphingomonas sp. Leaf21]|uniref:hypothetical protein n=1 Tax=Sphingomonas sp. Leaf21 TaxID=2876550 RepID=UPI001E4EA2FC
RGPCFAIRLGIFCLDRRHRNDPICPGLAAKGAGACSSMSQGPVRRHSLAIDGAFVPLARLALGIGRDKLAACGPRSASRLEDLAWDILAGTNDRSGLLA